MRTIYVITQVPDDCDKEEAAACLAGSHPFMRDPIVYDSVEDLLSDIEREDACGQCRRHADELYGDESLCAGCFGPDSPVTIG